MNELTDELIAQLKDKHGPDLFLVEPESEADRGLFVVVARNKKFTAEFEALTKQADAEGADKMGIMRNFIRAVVVYPASDILNQRFETYPGLANTYLKAIQVEAKSTIKVITKKL